MDIDTAHYHGLSSQEVRDRADRGLINTETEKKTKSIKEIIFSNVFTLFNILNFVIFALVMLTGSYKNGLFICIILCNLVIGVIQEIKAKRTIDAISIVTSPTAEVIRDGKRQSIPSSQLVTDDLFLVSTGAQFTVDGVVTLSEGLEVDESLLTGESDPVLKQPGDRILSGSFVVAGSGCITATKVGKDSYANQLSDEAKNYKRARSEILASFRLITKTLTMTIAPLGVLLFTSQFFRDGMQWQDAILATSAAVVGMIPEGLILLTTVSFAVSIIKLARKKTVVQELAAVEVMARTGLICLDKTGTLTEGRITVEQAYPLDERMENELALGCAAVCAAFPDKNSTAAAVAQYCPSIPDWAVVSSIPFSSARKFSSVSFDGSGTYLLGAPEFVLKGKEAEAVLSQCGKFASKGYRVVVLAHLDRETFQGELDETPRAVGFLLLRDVVKPSARTMLDYFQKHDVTVKIISGDNPAAVSSIAASLGFEHAEQYFDAEQLPEEDDKLLEVLKHYNIFGRVTPAQKKRIVAGYKALGNTVAMTGDGVNDVPALREADCSIAMASGSDAAKQVAHIVMLNSDFTSVPNIILEGRRVVGNIERVSCLYLVKTIFSTLLTIFHIIIGQTYPFLPIHMSVVSSFAVGIPTFFLALEPNSRRIQPHFLRRVLSFALPGALTVTSCVIITRILEACNLFGFNVTQQLAVTIYASVAFLILYKVSVPFSKWRAALFFTMLTGFLIVYCLPEIMEFHALNLQSLLVAAVVFVVVVLLLRLFEAAVKRWLAWYEGKEHSKRQQLKKS